LPRICIPVRADVDDLEVALQPVLDQVYSEGRYADLIDSTQPPPLPAMSRDDAQWVTEQVARGQVTRARHNAEQ